MRIVILTPVRLLGEGLVACLGGKDGVIVDALVNDFGALRHAIGPDTNVVLIDVGADFDATEVCAIAAEHPHLTLLAVGLRERRDEVIRCARAGFTAYVPRDASVDTLRNAMLAAVVGRLTCPPEITCGLMRALFGASISTDAANGNELTRREGDVLNLLGRGLANKEIARELDLSVATVKHHVHSILGKLGVARRTQAMRRVREAPWIAQVF
jgi:two-component system nitrate/nitrite response regulator NarL